MIYEQKDNYQKMKTSTYIDFVTESVGATSYGVPIQAASVANSLAEAFSLDVTKARKLANVYLKRLADQGVISRLKKGIYARAKMSALGAFTPGRDKIIAETLLRDGDEIIGYETGASFLNHVGLSTLLPRHRHIATNSYRATVPSYTGITLKKPIIPVTTQNAPYLQMLELFRDMSCYSIDTHNPEELIGNLIDQQGLNRVELVRYASAYLKPDELQNIIEIVFGRLEKYEAA